MKFNSYFTKSFESLNDAQHSILSAILETGVEANPRGMRTLELFPVAFALLNPRRRCITTPHRRWSLPLALGEFCWHLSGSRELEFIEYYAPTWRKFAEDELIQGSCYGHKIFNRESNVISQWDRLVELLRSDPDSRRAMLLLSEPISDTAAGDRDVACASVLQFMIRAGQVHAFVHMRSNDAIWGLPYDVFLFTMLQELLARELSLELGNYYHFASSLHLYERHIELAKRIVESPVTDFFEMPRMSEPSQVADFLVLEAETRSGTCRDATKLTILDSYWRELLSVLEWYSSKRETRDRCEHILMTYHGTYSPLLNNLLHKSDERLSS